MSALVIANWKMNGGLPAIATFAEGWKQAARLDGVRTVICPPFPYLGAVAAALSTMELGAQDCSAHRAGAYTGEVAADMLAECGCDWVIVGHSERRQYHAETDALVASKAQQVMAANMTAVVCVGESLADRESGAHEAVVVAQVMGSLADVSAKNLVVAYEPVWAIGTGRTATPEQANDMHRVIRETLATLYGQEADEIPVIYGGSVKPDNAAELFACDMIDGALVGGASLEAESFLAIAQAASSGRT